MAEKLGEQFSDLKMNDSGHSNIRKVAYYEAYSSEVESDTLYICKHLPPPMGESNACFLFAAPLSERTSTENYIYFPYEIDYQHIFTLLQDYLLSLANWDNRILTLALHGYNIQKIIDISEPLFPYEIGFYSLYHDQTFRSGQTKGSKSLHIDQLMESYYLSSFRNGLLSSNLPGGFHTHTRPMMIKAPLPENEPNSYLTCNIFYHGLRMGLLAAQIPEEQLRLRHRIYMQEIASCITLMFDTICRAPSEATDPYIEAILAGKKLTDDDHEAYEKEHPWFVNGHTLRVSVINSCAPMNHSFRNDRLLHRNILARIYRNSHIILYGEYILMMRDFTLFGDYDQEEHYTYLTNFLHNTNTVLGSSMPFSDITKLRRFYEQAKAAASGPIRGEETIRDYSYYLAYDLISKFSDEHALSHYIHPSILKLVQGSPRDSGELLHTLYCYLMNDRSYQTCAQKLHIHKSTFAYRLQKIQQIISLDLSEEHIRLSIILSICMYWYLHPEADPIGIANWRST